MSPNIKKIFKIAFVIFIALITISVSLAYIYYLDLKKTLVNKISAKATESIGQQVNIEDLSFSPSAGIDLYNIIIKNPEGFEAGQLLRIKRLHLNVQFRELFERSFSFKDITLYSPELTAVRGKNGRINVSDKLMEFVMKKSTTRYSIGEFNIISGIIDFNRDIRLRNANINLRFRGLSSSRGVKTLIDGATSYAGGQIRISGWAYLKDDPKKFALSVSSEDIALAPFREILQLYGMHTEKARVALNLQAEGDTEAGVNLRSKFQIKNTSFLYVRNEVKDILLNMEAFFNMRDNSVLIKDLLLNIDEFLSLRFHALITGITKDPVYSSELRISKADLSAFQFAKDFAADGTMTSDNIRIKGNIKEVVPEISGAVTVKNASLKKDSKKHIFKDAFLKLTFDSKNKDLAFKIDSNIGKIQTKISGAVKRYLQKDRIIDMKINQPEIKVADIRNALWEVFPDSLLYAGMDGSVSSDVSIHYSEKGLKANGRLALNNLVLQGENGEYSVGPVKGTLPIAYGKTDDEQETPELPSFERSEFDNLNKYYSQKIPKDGYSKITVGSLSYGFKFLEDIDILIKQQGNFLNIGFFSGNIFGGRFNGSAVFDISNGLNYRAGFVLKGLSLKKLCESIEPIKGYISGRVDGIGAVKGTGAGISDAIGMADFWTYDAADEKRKISKEFLKKIGGPSLKTYLGDRRFDKGTMSVYLQNGFVIFKELEISHKNLIGMQDLSLKVAPFNNRISFDHLMWSITEASQRAKKD